MKHLLLLPLLTFLLSSCAAKKMAVNHADSILESQIEKRLPLYSEQKTALSKDIAIFLNEQKSFAKEALPIISNIELDVKKVDPQYEELNLLYRKLAINFAGLMSKHMAPLDSKQQRDFNKNLGEENDKLAKAKGNEQMKRIYSRFETLFGSMTEEQKTLLKTHKAYFEQRDALRLQRRRELHDKFKEIYGQDLSNEARARYFLEAFTSYQNSYPNGPKNKEIIKQIIPTLSAKQREVFKQKTNDLKEIVSYYLETVY